MLARSEQSGISEPMVGVESAGAQNVHHHQSLLDVSQAILQHRDLDGLFRDLAVRLRSIAPFDFISLVFFDAATNTMRLHILESTVEPHVPEMEIPADESPSGGGYFHQEQVGIAGVNRVK